MTEFLNKIEASFKRAMRGEEIINTLFWYWGGIAYLLAYFIANRLILAINFKSIDIIISLLMVIYFSWHIYVVRKCKPKTPKLTKEEKDRLTKEQRQERSRRFIRKLFLQEPLSKWDPFFVAVVIDVFCIAHFLGYITR